MIYVHPIGGMANMMFHIATIWTLAKDNNDILVLLDIDKKINNLIHDGRINLDHANDYKYLFDRFPQITNYSPNKIGFAFEELNIPYIPNREYVGYFQSEEYFKHRRSEILELFKPAESFIGKINAYSNLFNNISLHVRRNDYVKLYPEIHIPQQMEYYNEALSLLPQDKKVLIFSDDLPWCYENFIGDRFIFIKELDYISMYLMSKMKYHIIANSSFSWWGAWLGESEKVIAPKKWFGNDLNYENIVPKNWLKI